MESEESERQIAGLSVLEEPVRRSLYFYLGYRQRDVSRDEAAEGTGAARQGTVWPPARWLRSPLTATSPSRTGARSGCATVPFHYLASEHRQLVCGMTLALIEASSGAWTSPAEPRLDPKPAMCCVTLRRR